MGAGAGLAAGTAAVALAAGTGTVLAAALGVAEAAATDGAGTGSGLASCATGEADAGTGGGVASLGPQPVTLKSSPVRSSRVAGTATEKGLECMRNRLTFGTFEGKSSTLADLTFIPVASTHGESSQGPIPIMGRFQANR
jgi:hypothetical protein